MFHYFGEISKIPRGSGNMKGIADYCESFAKSHGLRYLRDSADNVVIYKAATVGHENGDTVILQGHLDIVCQKIAEKEIDFEKEGITFYTDGDFIKADGTTLGADNGVAVAMIFALLESESYAHPSIEAVFTVDEEVGMLGALQLDMSLLGGKKMINIDSEEEATVTVSCAGGRDFTAEIPLERKTVNGVKAKISLSGLLGGHSGVEINSGRVNAALLMGRILDAAKEKCDFEIAEINGGNKANAIPNACDTVVVTADYGKLCAAVAECAETVKKEIKHREPDFCLDISEPTQGEFAVFTDTVTEKLLYLLMSVPNGVTQMSAEIDGLVETSLNLGILETAESSVKLCISLRSNKESAMEYLEKRLATIFDKLDIPHKTDGYYPPWEFNDNSELCKLYCDIYKAHSGKECTVAAIHAGLECGVFSAAIKGLDCISVGPALYDVHTTAEKLSISSTEKLFAVLVDLLSKL